MTEILKSAAFALTTSLSLAHATASLHPADPPACAFELGGITYRVPALSGQGFVLRPADRVASELIAADPQVESIGETFRFDGLTRAYRPFPVFTIRDEAEFSRGEATSVLDLLIKSPGLDYAVPRELAQFKETIERIITFEHSINPNAGDYYAYLTVDQSSVEPGTTQRQSGWQLDGFQGGERTPREPLDHSYLVSDRLPEIFTTQRFYFRGFDYNLHNIFSELDRQALPQFEVRGTPYQVYLANAYTPHRSPMAHVRDARTFLRLTFSRARFDKLGSSDNPMLPYRWHRTEKTLRRSLAKYLPNAGANLLPETYSLDQVRGKRLGLVTLGGADARVAAHVAEMLITNDRHVAFIASVQPALAYVGGVMLDEDLLRIDDTFHPLHPIAEMAFAPRLPTYLIFRNGDLKGALRDLAGENEVDGLVFVDVGGRTLTPVFANDAPLIEHRVLDAIDGQGRDEIPHRSLIIAAAGYGLPADASETLRSKARRYRPTRSDQLRVMISGNKWDQMAPRAARHEVAAQMWRQAVAQDFGPQFFPLLNPQDPPIEIKPEHQDLLLLSLDDVQSSTIRRVR